MTTPRKPIAAFRELMHDIQGQAEEANRAMREEERDARIEDDPRDDPSWPDKQDLAEMAWWDRIAERREREARR